MWRVLWRMTGLDPKGEFLSAYRASEVYSLYDKAGCPGPAQPRLNQSVGEGSRVSSEKWAP